MKPSDYVRISVGLMSLRDQSKGTQQGVQHHAKFSSQMLLHSVKQIYFRLLQTCPL